MAGYGYSYVTAKGFVACQQDLSEGAWGGTSIASYDTPERKLPAAVQAAPRDSIWKLRLTWVIEDLKLALGMTNLDPLDAAWDGGQRRLYYRLGALREDKDPAVRAAAERLSGLLLVGRGTEQTTYDYHAEVDFGRNQVLLTKSGQAADDVKTLKLEDTIADVDATTEALAQGLGRKDGSKRQVPSVRQREAVAACAAAFNVVHDDIAWWREHTQSGPEQERLSALLVPLQALLERNPPPVREAAPEAPPEKDAAAKDTAGGSKGTDGEDK